MIEYTQAELRLMAVFSGIGAAFSFLVGGVDKPLAALLVFIAVDYATGLAAAWHTSTLNSSKGFSGIKRKMVILIVVVIAHWIDEAVFGGDTCRTMVTFAYLGNEGLSIVENLDRMGYSKHIPSFIRKKLMQLREKKGGETNAKNIH